jgi:hypothetical protein
MRVIPDHDEVISLDTCCWKVYKGIKLLAALFFFVHDIEVKQASDIVLINFGAILLMLFTLIK